MKAKNHLLIPFILNLIFTIVEFIGGILTNSIALISDSIHDIGDSISIGVSMILEQISKKPTDDYYTYGYKRYSLLGGLISSIVLIIGSGIIIYEAIPRLISPKSIHSQELIYFAVLGLTVNLFAAMRARRGKSINEKVISLHLFEDALGWAALLIAAILIELFHIFWIDPVLSIVFTLYILSHVYKNIKSIINVFMEIAPTKPSVEEVSSHLQENKFIKDVHHIHLWTIDGIIKLATLHIVLYDHVSKQKFIETQVFAHQLLKELGIHHSTIEFEYEGNPCDLSDCEDTLTSTPIESHLHHHHH